MEEEERGKGERERREGGGIGRGGRVERVDRAEVLNHIGNMTKGHFLHPLCLAFSIPHFTGINSVNTILRLTFAWVMQFIGLSNMILILKHKI